MDAMLSATLNSCFGVDPTNALSPYSTCVQRSFNLSSVQEVIPVFMPISFEATGSPPSINVGVDGWMLPFSGLRGTVETVIPPFCVRLPLRISHQFMNVYGRLLQFTIIYQFRKCTKVYECYANHVASASP